jgi:hypothetical protein
MPCDAIKGCIKPLGVRTGRKGFHEASTGKGQLIGQLHFLQETDLKERTEFVQVIWLKAGQLQQRRLTFSTTVFTTI